MASPRDRTASRAAIVRLRTASGVRRCMIPFSATIEIPSDVPITSRDTSTSGNSPKRPTPKADTATPAAPKTIHRGSVRAFIQRPNTVPSTEPVPQHAISRPKPHPPVPKDSASGASATIPMPIPRTKTSHAKAIRRRTTLTPQIGGAREQTLVLGFGVRRPLLLEATPDRQRDGEGDQERDRVQPEDDRAGHVQPVGQRRVAGREDRHQAAADHRPDRDPGVHAHRHEAVRPREIVLGLDEVRDRRTRRRRRTAARRSRNRTRARSGGRGPSRRPSPRRRRPRWPRTRS